MTGLTESLMVRAWRELRERVCAGCGGKKLPGRSFCGACYHQLPHDLQRHLYYRLGDGYEEAYDEAREFLLAEKRAKKS